MTETFSLTGVEIEEKEKPQQQPVQEPIKEEKIQEKKPEIQEKKPIPRPRVLSQDSNKEKVKKVEKLPRLNLPKSNFRIRSQSTMNLPTTKKLDSLKNILDETKPSLTTVRKTKQFAAPQSAQSFLDIYHSKIQGEYDQLYNTGDYSQIMSQIKGIEKKQVMLDQIEKNQTFLQKEMNLYNKIGHEQKGKEQKLQNLLFQIEMADKMLQRPEQADILDRHYATYEKLQEKYEDQMYFMDTLENMERSRIEEVNFKKKQCQSMYLQAKELDEQLNLQLKTYQNYYDEENVNKLRSEIQKLKTQGFTFSTMNMPQKFEDQLEEELSEFADKKAIEEIFKHEEKQRQEREKQKRKEKQAEEKKLRLEQEQIYKEIQKEMKQVERQLNHEREKFENLRNVTQVRSVETLLRHKDYLTEGKEGLKSIQDEYRQKIQINQEQINKLKEQKKKLFEQKQEEDEQSMLFKIEKLEKNCQEEQDKFKDSTKLVTKKRNCIDQMCLLVSRILFQLQSKQEKIKNFEVKRDDLSEMVNVSSLMLERINGLLQKNQGDYVKVESINTDTTHELPPSFLGLSAKKTTIHLKFDRDEQQQDTNRSDSGINVDSQNVSEIREQIKQRQSNKLELSQNISGKKDSKRELKKEQSKKEVKLQDSNFIKK